MPLTPVVSWTALRSQGGKASVGFVRIYTVTGACHELDALPDDEFSACVTALQTGRAFWDLRRRLVFLEADAA